MSEARNRINFLKKRKKALDEALEDSNDEDMDKKKREKKEIFDKKRKETHQRQLSEFLKDRDLSLEDFSNMMIKKERELTAEKVEKRKQIEIAKQEVRRIFYMKRKIIIRNNEKKCSNRTSRRR